MRTCYALALLLIAPSLVGACARAEASSLPQPDDSTGAPDLAVIAAASGSQAPATVSGLTASATTHPSQQAALAPKASGVLDALLVDEGDVVKRGQPLFRLESVMASLQIVQAKAAVASAQVGVDAATLEFDRTRRLFDTGALSQAELDRATSARDSAIAAKRQAEAALGLAQKVAADTTTLSPIDGVVTFVGAHRGETVTMMPPTIILSVENLNPLEVRASLPENALRNLEKGDVMRVKFTALGVTRETTIARVAPRVDPASRTVEVLGLVDNADLSLRSGMLVEAEFPSATRNAPESQPKGANSAGGGAS